MPVIQQESVFQDSSSRPPSPPYKHWRGKSGTALDMQQSHRVLFPYFTLEGCSVQKGFHYVSSPASNALFSGSLDLQGLVGIIDTPATFRSEVQAKFYSGELESRRSMKAKC